MLEGPPRNGRNQVRELVGKDSIPSLLPLLRGTDGLVSPKPWHRSLSHSEKENFHGLHGQTLAVNAHALARQAVLRFDVGTEVHIRYPTCSETTITMMGPR